MNDIRVMLTETAEKLFTGLATPEVVNASEQGVWATNLWQAVEAAGLPRAAVPEDLGGSGGVLGDAFAVVGVAAAHSAPIPLAETVLAGWALSSAGLAVPDGPLTVVPETRGDAIIFTPVDGGGWRLTGTARHVAWARHAHHIVVVGRDGDDVRVGLVKAADCDIQTDVNLAGEPADHVGFGGVHVAASDGGAAGASVTLETLWEMGALARTVQMAGALERAFALTVRYTSERVQFGRALSKFQAVQQEIALMAGEVAAAGVAADAAVAAAEKGAATQAIAAAKARVGQAAGMVAASAHQLHGAMGFTQEHSLHHSTRRLWAWRDEYGSEGEWAEALGSWLVAQGGAGIWPFVSGSRAGLKA